MQREYYCLSQKKTRSDPKRSRKRDSGRRLGFFVRSVINGGDWREKDARYCTETMANPFAPSMLYSSTECSFPPRGHNDSP